MKKSILLLALPLLFLTAPTLQAQNTPTSTDDINKNEISFNVGAFPWIGNFYATDALLGPVDITLIGYSYNDDRGDGMYLKSYLIGTFSLEYKYNFNSHHAIGVTASWACRKRIHQLRDYTVGIDNYVLLQVGYKYTYKHYDKCSIYSAINVGATLYIRDNEFLFSNWDNTTEAKYWAVPSMQLTLVGISLGKKNAANIELGFGTQGILNFGYAYKF